MRSHIRLAITILSLREGLASAQRALASAFRRPRKCFGSSSGLSRLPPFDDDDDQDKDQHNHLDHDLPERDADPEHLYEKQNQHQDEDKKLQVYFVHLLLL